MGCDNIMYVLYMYIVRGIYLSLNASELRVHK